MPNPEAPKSQPLGRRQQALVDALRSEQFQQGKQALKRDGKYCCLGVACQISGLGEWWNNSEGCGEYYKVQTQMERTVLPAAVLNYYSFRDNSGLAAKEEFGMLTQKNDNGWSFQAIAKLLEDHPEQFFSEPR